MFLKLYPTTKNLINDVEVDANTQKKFLIGAILRDIFMEEGSLINKDYSFNMGSLVMEIKNKEVKF